MDSFRYFRGQVSTASHPFGFRDGHGRPLGSWMTHIYHHPTNARQTVRSASSLTPFFGTFTKMCHVKTSRLLGCSDWLAQGRTSRWRRVGWLFAFGRLWQTALGRELGVPSRPTHCCWADQTVCTDWSLARYQSGTGRRSSRLGQARLHQCW